MVLTRILRFKLLFRPWEIVLIIAAIAVGYVGLRVFASGASAAYITSGAIISGKTSIVTQAGAIGGRMLQFGTITSAAAPASNAPPTPAPAAPPTPPPAGTQSLHCIAVPHLCGFPDATNTGTQGQALTKIDDDFIITSPGTYSNLDITGSLVVKADHVTVSHVLVRGSYGDGGCLCGSYDTLTDSELGGGANGTTFTGVGSGIYSGGDQNTHNLIQRVNIHHTDDGLRLDGGTVVRDSYIHDLSNGANGSHSDNSQSCEGTYFSFIHNTFLGGNNDPIFLQGGGCGGDNNLFLDHVVVDNNLLTCLHEPDNISGYGISIGRGRHINITNNHFDRGWQVAAVGVFLPDTLVQTDGTTPTTASNWAQNNNIWDDTGVAIPYP